MRNIQDKSDHFYLIFKIKMKKDTIIDILVVIGILVLIGILVVIGILVHSVIQLVAYESKPESKPESTVASKSMR